MTAVPEDFVPGLEGVVAFTTEIAEPDKDGGALRYRGVDIEELVELPGHFRRRVGTAGRRRVRPRPAAGRAVPAADPQRRRPRRRAGRPGRCWRRSGAIRRCSTSTTHTAREQLARASVMALSYVAQSARGIYQPAVPQRMIDECSNVTARFMTRWQGEPDPKHVEAIDAYWVSAAEHGLNASTFTARVIASTGADVAAALSGAIGAMCGPLHGGAPARVLPMIEEAEQHRRRAGGGQGHPGPQGKADGLRAPRLPRRGSSRPGAARHRQTPGRPRYEVTAALEQAALTELRDAAPTAPSRPMSSSGRRSSSTSPRSPRT